jgi:hypothetical protein
MANYEDDDLDEIENNDDLVEEEGAVAAAGNRNFLLALGVLGGIFLLLIIGLVLLFLSRQPGADEAASIQLTNDAIYAANTQTAGAATLIAVEMLTPSPTSIPTNTNVPPTPTRTSVVALATATATLDPALAAISTATSSPVAGSTTGTVPAVLTQVAEQTRTQVVVLTLTATARLPQSGFAEDVGLPGLFGLALGLVMVIVLVRRLRISTN